ncbi:MULTISPECIES: hypothetical protein [unclassified Streptomyces]|nr:hypothetical protein OG324_51525 [Streptomyces sp. NBC_01236]
MASEATCQRSVAHILNLADELVLAHDQHLGPVEAHLHEVTTHAAPDPSP